MYQLYFRPYHRPFRQPLHTAWGVWKVRSGILIALGKNGRWGWGEIAPLPAFGSETLEDALKLCQQFSGSLERGQIFNIPDTFPACQFAFESALAHLEEDSEPTPNLVSARLLPTGDAALKVLSQAVQSSTSPQTWKWKIGVRDWQAELPWFAQLLQQLPPQHQLRLDANGGLTPESAERWLAACEGQPVEFLEQPLPPHHTEELLALAGRFSTPIALDESVANLHHLETWLRRGWLGVVVVKAAIVGSPRKLRQLCQQYRPDVVFSSVFETSIGRASALALAAELQTQPRAVGFGVSGWFAQSHAEFLQELLADCPIPPNKKSPHWC